MIESLGAKAQPSFSILIQSARALNKAVRAYGAAIRIARRAIFADVIRRTEARREAMQP